MAEVKRYAECKGCGNIFETKQPGRNIKCKCKRYAREITQEQFLEKSSKMPTETPEKEPKKGAPKKTESDDIVELELEDPSEEMEIPESELQLELPPEAAGAVAVVNGKKSMTNVEKPVTSNVLGAGLVIGLDVMFSVSKKEPLSPDEKAEIKEKAEAVSSKYDILSDLPYGEELELSSSVGSAIMKRWGRRA